MRSRAVSVLRRLQSSAHRAGAALRLRLRLRRASGVSAFQQYRSYASSAEGHDPTDYFAAATDVNGPDPVGAAAATAAAAAAGKPTFAPPPGAGASPPPPPPPLFGSAAMRYNHSDFERWRRLIAHSTSLVAGAAPSDSVTGLAANPQRALMEVLGLLHSESMADERLRAAVVRAGPVPPTDPSLAGHAHSHSREVAGPDVLKALVALRDALEKRRDKAKKTREKQMTRADSDADAAEKAALAAARPRGSGGDASAAAAQQRAAEEKRMERERAHARALSTFDEAFDADALVRELHMTLAVLGFHDLPLSRRRRGVRILSLDGGGTRALMSIEILKELERLSGGKPIRDQFDLICGTSTGALLGFLMGLQDRPLSEIETAFRVLCQDVFTAYPLIAYPSLVLSGAYYESGPFEAILNHTYGAKPLIDSAKRPRMPKVFATSCVVSRNIPFSFMHRNYMFHPALTSTHEGTCTTPTWHALRASTAAPTYFGPMRIGDDLHVDGGLIVNNPTSLGIHEAQRIWPGATIECVVSVGTGKPDATIKSAEGSKSLSWKGLLSNVAQAATSTATVHHVLKDLLPPTTYFRFNPIVNGQLALDEYRTEQLNEYQRIGRDFALQRSDRLKEAADVLRGSHYSFITSLVPPARMKPFVPPPTPAAAATAAAAAADSGSSGAAKYFPFSLPFSLSSLTGATAAAADGSSSGSSGGGGVLSSILTAADRAVSAAAPPPPPPSPQPYPPQPLPRRGVHAVKAPASASPTGWFRWLRTTNPTANPSANPNPTANSANASPAGATHAAAAAPVVPAAAVSPTASASAAPKQP